ncbi:piwi domain-containing protein [Ditylenchus destructor]|nr:piwi domain-containing protein [Ditylenchus destructor]
MADRPSTSKSVPKDERVPQKVKQIKKGTLGKRINIETNYLRLTITPPITPQSSVSTIYMYDVYLYPPAGANRKELVFRPQRRTAFWTAVRNNYQVFGDERQLVYDDGRRVYSRSKLYPLVVEDHPKPIEKELAWDFEYTYEDRPFQALIKIIPTESFRLTPTETGANHEQPRFLNCLLTQCLRLTGQQNLPNLQFSLNDLWFCAKRCVYRIPFDNFYEPLELGNYAYLYHGLRCAIKYDSNGLPLLNANLASAVFAKVNLEIIEFCASVVGLTLNERDLIQLRRYSMNRAQTQRMTDALKGLSLRARHTGMRYKCFGLVDYHSRNYQFPHPQFGSITVEEYIYRAYDHRTLQYPYLPLVQVYPQNPLILLPMELLYISDKVQQINKRLPQNIRAQITEATTFLPSNHFNLIAETLMDSTMLNNEVSRSFGLQFKKEFLKLQGRVLPKPKLYFQYADKGLCEPANERFYVVLICLNDAYFNDIGKTVWELVKICREKRLNVEDVSQHNIDFGVNDDIQRMQAFVIVIKEDEDTHGYEAVKTTLDQQGLISQFIKKSKAISMYRRNTAIMKSLVLKLNSKLGGLNNKILDCHEWEKFTTSPPTLIIGVDTILAARNDDMLSVVGVTGSIDETYARYSSGFCIFGSDEKNVPELVLMELIIKAIDAYAKHNNSAPKHIILLRGGLSESIYDPIAKVEFGVLGEACRRFEEHYSEEFLQNRFAPTLTYLIVSRNHSTRFKMETIPRGDRYNGNVPAGTVVDTIIAGQNDYYMCSHNGLLGTSRPAYYEIMYDTWELTGDNFQSFMYSLCHLVGRSRLPVSIPAPLYYADLLCKRVCTYINTEKRHNPGFDYGSIDVEQSLKKLTLHTMLCLLSFTLSFLVLMVSSKQVDIYGLDGYYWVCKDKMCHPVVVETETSPVVTAGGATYKRTDFPSQSPDHHLVISTRFFEADRDTVPKSETEDDFRLKLTRGNFFSSKEITSHVPGSGL